ncbi:Nitrite reductase [NAD(P)H] [compost metagenome]
MRAINTSWELEVGSAMERTRLLIIGNGMAGIKCVEEIIQLAPDQFDITVIGDEQQPNYNRIMLSKMLQGGAELNDIILNDYSWYAEHGIELITGERVIDIDPHARTVLTTAGTCRTYERLIIATGSSSFIPALPGVDLEGVISFRNIEDCSRMVEYSQRYKKAVVIGGGLLGLEAARGLLHLGMEVVVVHNTSYLMNRQLDEPAAGMLQAKLEGQGMLFRLSADTKRIKGKKQVTGLEFTDGTELKADIVVMAIGIRPNVALAKNCGLQMGRAIVVDDYMRTSQPHIYAVGECAEHRGITYGLVAPLYEQAKALAAHLCGHEHEGYRGSIPYSKLKISGVDVFSVGNLSEPGTETVIQQYDGIRRTYKRITAKNGVVHSAVLFGDTMEGTTLVGMVRSSASVSELAAMTAARADTGNDGSLSLVASMPDQETVCACNAVSKRTIMNTIREHNLQSAEEVRAHTKASGSCGGCLNIVKALVQYAHTDMGNTSQAAASPVQRKAPLCECTDLTHADVCSQLRELCESDPGLTTVAAMARLGWRSSTGCGLCMPAIEYYIDILHEKQGLQQTHKVSDHQDLATSGNSLYVMSHSADAMSGALAEQGRRLASRLSESWSGIVFPTRVNAVVNTINDPILVLHVQPIGLMRSPIGWEVYAGGHSHSPICEAQLVGVEEDEEHALQLLMACLQLYRHTSEYDERMSEWLDRIGLTTVREQLLDLEQRASLVDSIQRRVRVPLEQT